MTGNEIGDAPVLLVLLEHISDEEDIASVTADGVYDTRRSHETIASRGRSGYHPPAEKRKAMVSHISRSNCQTRNSAGLRASRTGYLETMEQLSLTKPHRNENALYQATGTTPERSQFRPPDYRSSCLDRRP